MNKTVAGRQLWPLGRFPAEWAGGNLPLVLQTGSKYDESVERKAVS
jgi:hypothetical protein